MVGANNNEVPGPGEYKQAKGFGYKGYHVISGIMKTKFGRKGKVKSDTPGPGSYEVTSEFYTKCF